jgi:hypothetical protein
MPRFIRLNRGIVVLYLCTGAQLQMARREILADITDLGLDPKKAHHVVSAGGRIRVPSSAEVKVEEAVPEVQEKQKPKASKEAKAEAKTEAKEAKAEVKAEAKADEQVTATVETSVEPVAETTPEAPSEVTEVVETKKPKAKK